MIQDVIARAEHFIEIANIAENLLSILREFEDQPAFEPACRRIAELLDSLLTPGNGF